MSRGEDSLVVLELLPSWGLSSGGKGGSEEEADDGRWWVMDSAIAGESSNRQITSSCEQNMDDRRRNRSMPPAPAISIFFSSGRRARLSMSVESVGLRGPWVLKISAKNLFHHQNSYYVHIHVTWTCIRNTEGAYMCIETKCAIVSIPYICTSP